MPFHRQIRPAVHAAAGGGPQRAEAGPHAVGHPGQGEPTDQELLGLVQSLPGGDRRRETACETLVARYEPVVRSCVHRYSDSPEPAEDLMQVGYLGLLKAINNYDPAIGDSLGAYAYPCVVGEIRRHFRAAGQGRAG
jgi:RNA polymerase sigma-B factor